jgi:uncharacterized protein YaiL (DUF2058 family)
MANSIQDQLLKAGLVSEEQARKSRQGKRKQRKSGKPKDDSARQAAAQRRAEQAERDRALNQKREAERREKELRQQIRDLVLEGSLNREDAQVPYNVLHGSTVRRMYVTAQQREALAAGTLAVATARGRHHVIPGELAERILALMPGYFVHRQQPSAAEVPAEDDPYAAYQVPDDLMW